MVLQHKWVRKGNLKRQRGFFSNYLHFYLTFKIIYNFTTQLYSYSRQRRQISLSGTDLDAVKCWSICLKKKKAFWWCSLCTPHFSSAEMYREDFHWQSPVPGPFVCVKCHSFFTATGYLKYYHQLHFFSAQHHRDLGGVEEYYRATLLEVSTASCMRCLHEEVFSGQKSRRVHKRAGWSRSSSKVAVTLEALETCSFW